MIRDMMDSSLLIDEIEFCLIFVSFYSKMHEVNNYYENIGFINS